MIKTIERMRKIAEGYRQEAQCFKERGKECLKEAESLNLRADIFDEARSYLVNEHDYLPAPTPVAYSAHEPIVPLIHFPNGAPSPENAMNEVRRQMGVPPVGSAAHAPSGTSIRVDETERRRRD